MSWFRLWKFFFVCDVFYIVEFVGGFLFFCLRDFISVCLNVFNCNSWKDYVGNFSLVVLSSIRFGYGMEVG